MISFYGHHTTLMGHNLTKIAGVVDIAQVNVNVETNLGRRFEEGIISDTGRLWLSVL